MPIIYPRRHLVAPQPGTGLNGAHPLAHGLSLDLTLSEGGGVPADSLTGRRATVAGAPAWGTDHGERTLDLVPGSGDALSVPSSVVGLDEGTFVLWCRSDFGPVPGATVYYAFDTDARHAMYHWPDESVGWSMYNDGRLSTFPASTWTIGLPVCFVFAYRKSDNTQRHYVDGAEVAPAAQSGSWGTTALGTSLYIGQRFNSVQQFDGRLARVTVYTRLLGPAEVRRLWLEPFGMYLP